MVPSVQTMIENKIVTEPIAANREYLASFSRPFSNSGVVGKSA